MKRAAITFTYTVDLDRLPGWGHDTSDWTHLVEQRLTLSDTYKPEVEIHEIQAKAYAYEEGTGYIRPTFVTMIDQLLEIKTIMATVNSNSEPDAMGAALDRINELLKVEHA